MKRLRDITHNLLSATEKYRDEGEDYPVSVSAADIDRLLEHIGRDMASARRSPRRRLEFLRADLGCLDRILSLPTNDVLGHASMLARRDEVEREIATLDPGSVRMTITPKGRRALRKAEAA